MKMEFGDSNIRRRFATHWRITSPTKHEPDAIQTGKVNGLNISCPVEAGTIELRPNIM